jgi:hypothetical protein
MTGPDRFGLAATRLESDQLDERMPREQAHQLGTDIARGPDDGDSNALIGEARPAVRRDRCGRLKARAHGRTVPFTGGRLGPRVEEIGWTAVMTA